MNINDTMVLMESSDYKDRFKAEYYQLKIRCEKLKEMLDKWISGTLGFTPTCSFELLNAQLHVMLAYKEMLEVRAIVESIDLSE